MRVGGTAHSLTEVRHVSYTGLGCRWVVAVSVEDLAEGERDWKMCLFKLEEPSKDPEKEVMAKRKREREREIDLAGKISLVGRTRQTKRGYGMKKAGHSAEEGVYDDTSGSSRGGLIWWGERRNHFSESLRSTYG